MQHKMTKNFESAERFTLQKLLRGRLNIFLKETSIIKIIAPVSRLATYVLSLDELSVPLYNNGN